MAGWEAITHFRDARSASRFQGIACEWSVMASSAECGVFRPILAQSLFFKTPYVWTTGGRGPVSRAVPGVER